MTKVAIDPGHRQDTPGKRCKGLEEWEFNKDVAERLQKHLQHNNLQAMLTITTDNHPCSETTSEGRSANLKYRTDRANNFGADVFVSIHANAFSDTAANGYEIYTLNADLKEANKLAKCIHKRAQQHLKVGTDILRDRGIKHAKFAVLRQSKMPAVLIEHAFYTNDNDRTLLQDDNFREWCAIHIACGICDYLDIPFKNYLEGEIPRMGEQNKTMPKSQGTPIIGTTKATILQAQTWASVKGAHQRFIDIAPTYWSYYEQTGINPEILYCQAAKETNFGRYTGAVKPEMNNWAGIKTANPTGDKTEDHECFKTPEDGVRAHFNHMGIYCGVDPIGTPHPRWYITKTAGWAGTVKYVEDLGGKWAPNIDYGISIVRDYLQPLYNTKADPPSTNYKALYQDAQGKLNKIKNIVEG